MTDWAPILTAENVVGLVLALGLIWVCRREHATPEARARIMTAVVIASFAVTGLARRLHHPWVEQITAWTWVVAITVLAWKIHDQAKRPPRP